MASERVDLIHQEARRRGMGVTEYIWSLVVQETGGPRADDPLVEAMFRETEALCAPSVEMTAPQRAALLLHKARIVKAIRQYAGSVPPQEWGVLLGIARELQEASAEPRVKTPESFPTMSGGRRTSPEPQPTDSAAWAAAAEELARQIEAAQTRARAALERAERSDATASRPDGLSRKGRFAPPSSSGRSRRSS